MSDKQWRPESDRPEKDDDFPSVKFGREARAWLRRLLTARIKTIDWIQTSLAAGDITAERLVEYFLAEPKLYVTWLDSQIYSGKGQPVGLWEVNWPAVEEDYNDAIRTVRSVVGKISDDERFPTLDDWLRADMAGELRYAGSASGMEDVPPEMRERTKELARQRELRRPIECASCGASFVRHRRNGRRCKKCLETKGGA